jgi:hypothetical protein
MANLLELCAKVCTFPSSHSSQALNPKAEESVIYGIRVFGAAIAITRGREVVKAFGGVLNGLDGNFGPLLRGQKMNARTNQFWRFPL